MISIASVPWHKLDAGVWREGWALFTSANLIHNSVISASTCAPVSVEFLFVIKPDVS